MTNTKSVNNQGKSFSFNSQYDLSSCDEDTHFLPLNNRRKTPRGRICVISDSTDTRTKVADAIKNTGLRISSEYQDLDEISNPKSLKRRTDLFIISPFLISTKGLETMKRARSMFGSKKIFVFLYELDTELAVDCYLQGAIGVFFQNNALVDTLKIGLKKSLLGQLFIQKSVEPFIDADLLREEARLRKIEALLTDTEYQILTAIRTGKDFSLIAKEMDMTTSSIGTKASLIRKKLGVNEKLIWQLIIECYLLNKPTPVSI